MLYHPDGETGSAYRRSMTGADRCFPLPTPADGRILRVGALTWKENEAGHCRFQIDVACEAVLSLFIDCGPRGLGGGVRSILR